MVSNGKTVKLKCGSIKFNYHFKQLAEPFKIYSDFECNVKGVRGSDRNNNTLNIKHIFWVVLLTKLFVVMANSASQLFLTEEK